MSDKIAAHRARASMMTIVDTGGQGDVTLSDVITGSTANDVLLGAALLNQTQDINARFGIQQQTINSDLCTEHLQIMLE